MKEYALPAPPSDLRAALLIARRAAVESLRDRSTVAVAIFFSLGIPLILALTTVGPGRPDEDVSGAALAVYILIVGLVPTSAAVGSAAGQFAGEHERGNLTPLLAAPVSNAAIFAGKVLGAVAPSLIFSLIAVTTYLGGVAVFAADRLGEFPVALTIAMIVLIPAVAIFAAAIASLISSRVRTYNTAQQIAGFALLPVWAVVGGLAFAARDWGTWLLIALVVGVVLVNALLVFLTATTWRREEVLARR